MPLAAAAPLVLARTPAPAQLPMASLAAAASPLEAASAPFLAAAAAAAAALPSARVGGAASSAPIAVTAAAPAPRVPACPAVPLPPPGGAGQLQLVVAPTIACAPAGSGRSCALGKRPAPAARSAPAYQISISGAPPPDVDLSALTGKGSKHAQTCAGPWVHALSLMPAPPISSGHARAAAGLGAVPISQTDTNLARRERSARALVSILPFEAAAVILLSPPDYIRQLDPAEVAERLVAALSGYGVGALDSAYTALGSFLGWVREHRPHVTVATGVEGADFFAAHPPSTSVLSGLNWLRDHCGLMTPGRAPVAKPFRPRGPRAAPVLSHDKRSLSLAAVLSLEYIAAYHPSPTVAGQAAMWYCMAMAALRAEQARGLVINAFVPRGRALIACASAVLDKNPNPEAMSPRPVWFDVSGICHPGAVHSRLLESLDAAVSARALLLDTDSPSGDPVDATSFVAAPLALESRVCASIRALLQLPPLSLPAESASAYAGHSAKRFLLNFAMASPAFNEVDCNEVGRFSGSTAQSKDLTPTAAMLSKHSLRCAVLPEIYAGKTKVDTALSLIERASDQLRSWALGWWQGSVELSPEDGWDQFRDPPPPVPAVALPLDGGCELTAPSGSSEPPLSLSLS